MFIKLLKSEQKNRNKEPINFPQKKIKKMEILTVTREKKSTYNCVTTLKDNQGKVKAILNGYNQPKKSQKTIEIRNKTYNLKFID